MLQVLIYLYSDPGVNGLVHKNCIIRIQTCFKLYSLIGTSQQVTVSFAQKIFWAKQNAHHLKASYCGSFANYRPGLAKLNDFELNADNNN